MTRKPRPRDTSTPLAFMLDIMRDTALPDDLRLKAATQAAPYCHPTRQIIEHHVADGDKPASVIEIYAPPMAKH